MSCEDHSASTSSAAGNGNAFAKGKQPATWGRSFNKAIEIGPSIADKSVTLSRGNHSTPPSVRRNRNAPAERLAWRRKPSNDVRPPNKSIWRLNNNLGTFNETSTYRAPNVTAPHMEFPQPNMQAYGTAPLPILPIPFNGNPEPSTSSSFQSLNVFPYASYCPPYNYYPTHPHVGCFIPLQDIYASQQSYFFTSLDDLQTRLQKQIEYYFSSGNLETDYFLKRHMDANGWVPITLIAGFKRVEALLKEAQLLYNYLRSLNFMLDQGDKIRKRHEWQKWVSPQNPALSNDESADQPEKTPN